MNQELPTMTASSYASNTVQLAQFQKLANDDWVKAQAAGVAQRRLLDPTWHQPSQHEPLNMKDEPKMTTRVVQIFIADPNENIPIEDRLLYKGDQIVTDLTDQELFYEIDLKDRLRVHNEKRVKVVNKAVKDRTEHLEPARIRDLKMVVVTAATF